MSHFTHLTSSDAFAMRREIAYNPESRAAVAGLSADCYVLRADDNGGTFILSPEDDVIAFVSISTSSEDGEWLYYSDDVANFFGVKTWQGPRRTA